MLRPAAFAVAAALCIVNSVSSQILNPANGHYYQQVTSSLDWFAAHNAANNAIFNETYGHLATVTSQDELDFLSANFDLEFDWQGGFQMLGSPEPDQGWRWITGEEWNYTNWNVDEPNNLNREDGLQFFTTQGHWNDAARVIPQAGYIVEFPVGASYSPILKGDFDGNAVVNPGDLPIWQETYGSTDILVADTNRSGRVTGRDFLDWQRGFETTAAAHSSPSLIGQLKGIPLGSQVTVIGTLTNTVDLINSTASKNFYLQDATGGINVFSTNQMIDSLLAGKSVGDKVSITGTLGSNMGSIQITPNTLSRVTIVGGTQNVQPIGISPSNLVNFSPVAESLENMLVSLSNVRFLETGTFAGLTNYTVTDGTSTAVVRVSTTFQDLVGQPIPTNPVNLVGLLSQFDAANPLPGFPGSNYQIYVRTLADITPVQPATMVNVPEPSAAMLLAVATIGMVGLKRLRNPFRRQARPSPAKCCPLTPTTHPGTPFSPQICGCRRPQVR